MRSMEAYPRAAMERAMKVQDVMLQAMAKKITWWQAAEILGISDRDMRPLAGALRRRRLQRAVRSTARQADAAAGAGGDGGESVRAVPGKIFRSECAALSREVAGRAWDRTELHLGEAGIAGSRPGGARTQARGASQAAGAAAVAGDAVAYRRQPPPVVSGRTLV